jgi:predicted nucleotidyltransferase component of viral defense system
VVTIARIREVARIGSWDLQSTERVLRMGEVLAAIATHVDVRDCLVLKGGTAINVVDRDMARLSVDLDFDFVGAIDREGMLAARPRVEAAIEAIAARLAMPVRRAKDDHGGCTWQLRYDGVVGSGVVQIDLNFLRRSPTIPPRRVDVDIAGTSVARHALVVAGPELAAGKLCALLDRSRPRDVWDAALLADSGLDDPQLRRCLIVLAAGVRRPWRELLGREIELDVEEADRMLVPLLRVADRPDPADLDGWAFGLVERVEQAVAPLRIPTDSEVAFLDAVTERGEVDPGLLGIDPKDPMHDAILRSPPLAWKARNVREARGG